MTISDTCTTASLCGLFLSCQLLSLPVHADAGRWQPHGEIRDVAAKAVRSAAADTAGTIDVVADSPDPRLRLPRCEEPLKAVLPSNAGKASSSGWTI